MNTQIDFEQARLNMIEQQIRTWEVLDQDVLDLIYQVHREDFVPGNYKQVALADTNIPLANGQVMMTPKLEARLLQAVALQKNDRVLEIGTG
ncbi:MAG: protein-L-isoaspartate O-methyltransferase, partial [Gammaproteobacteria bacterium]|nr:protein-L-isoaspartate O-methyltransferase [Gammaproteobacteria bacterium]